MASPVTSSLQPESIRWPREDTQTTCQAGQRWQGVKTPVNSLHTMMNLSEDKYLSFLAPTGGTSEATFTKSFYSGTEPQLLTTHTPCHDFLLLLSFSSKPKGAGGWGGNDGVRNTLNYSRLCLCSKVIICNFNYLRVIRKGLSILKYPLGVRGRRTTQPNR